MTSPQPVVCTLSVPNQGARKAELESGLAALIQEVRSLADGYALRFAAGEGVRAAVDDFIAFERECCAFMTFEIRDVAGGGLWLELRGPDGTVDFLRDWIPQPGGHSAGGGLSWRLWAAAVGGAGALFALVCCATPLLAVLLGVVGLGASMASIAPLVDFAALVLVAIAAVLLALEWRSRRRQPVCDC